MADRWEYLIHTVDDSAAPRLADDLNALGLMGWEAVSTTVRVRVKNMGNELVVLLKRPLAG